MLWNKVMMPTASKAMLKKLKLTGDAKASFMKQYRNFLVGMTQKFQERSPLQYAIVRCAASLNPVQMSEFPSEASILFRGLIDVLFEHKRLTSNEGDDVKVQFDEFVSAVCSTP